MTSPVGHIELVVESDLGAFAAQTEAKVKATAGQLGKTMDAEMTQATTRAGVHGSNAGAAYTRGRDGKLRDSKGKFVKEADSHGAGAAAAMGKRGEQAGEAFSKGILGKMGGVGSGITKMLNSALGTNLSGSAFGAAAIVGIGAAAVKMAGDFQTSMTRLVTAAGESKQAIGMVSNGVLQIARDTGTSTKQLASAMYMIESAGFHGAAALNIARAAAEGAKVDMADTGVVANALTTAMNDLHAPTSSAATVMSQLVAAVGHGKMTMDDLAGSLHSVLPNAAALHLGMGEVAGALATMTAQGISADQASQNLNHAILALARPTAVQTNTMAAYGINASKVAQQLGQKGLAGTLDELQRAIMAKMGPAGLTLTKALNQSQIDAGKAATMYKNLSGPVQQIIDKWKTGAITSVQANKEMRTMGAVQANLGMQYERTWKRANGFNALLKSGSPDAQTFTAAMAGMTGGQVGLQVALHLTGENMKTYRANIAAVNAAHAEAGNHVKDWAEKQKTFNQQMSQLKERVVTAVIAIGMRLLPVLTDIVTFINQHVAPAMAAMIAGISKFIGWIKDNRGEIEGFVATLAAFALAVSYNSIVLRVYYGWIRIMTAAQAAWNLVMDANPIMLIALAIAGLVAGVIYAYKHFKTFHDIIDAIGRFLKAAFLGYIHMVEAEFRILGAAIMGTVHFFQTLWDRMTAIAVALVGFFKAHWRLLLTVFTGGLGLILVVVIDHMRQIVGFVQRMWRDVTGWFTRLRIDLEVIMIAVWTKASYWFTRIWHDITGFVTHIWRDVTGFFTKIATDVWAILSPFWTRIWQGWTNIATTITGVAQSIWSKVTGFFGKLRDAVVASVQGAVGGVKTAWDKIKDIVAAPIRFVVDTVYDHGIVPIWNGIAGILHENSMKLDPIHFAAGGTVPGRISQGDNVPVMATRGEGILNHGGMAAIGGPAGLNALNSTGPGGGQGHGGHYAGGGLIGGIGHLISSATSGIAKLARGALAAGITPGIQGLESMAAGVLNPMGGMGRIADQMVNSIGNAVISFVRGDDASYLKSIAGMVGGDHAALIEKALQLAGVAVTPGNVADVDLIVKFESGWNPNAINLTDSNAQAGHPSQGLMQTIPSTFAAYTIPGFNNITDPIGNMIAGIRYAIARYGSLDAVPGVAAVHAGGSYVGYDSGGPLMPGVTLAYNGTGKPEHVFTHDQIGQLIAAVSAPKRLHFDRTSVATLVNDQNRYLQDRRT